MNDNEAIGLKRIVVDYLRRWKLFWEPFILISIGCFIYCTSAKNLQDYGSN